jgi:hypothetical protein
MSADSLIHATLVAGMYVVRLLKELIHSECFIF